MQMKLGRLGDGGGSAESGMSIQQRRVGEVVVLELMGELRLGASLGLDTVMLQLIEQGVTRFVVNLGGTRAWQSILVGELVKAYTRTRDACSMKLAEPPGRLNDILAVCKLDTVFEMYETEDSALRSFGDSRTPRQASSTRVVTPNLPRRSRLSLAF